MEWTTASGKQLLTAPAVLNLGTTSQLTYKYTCYLQNGTPCSDSYTLPSAQGLDGGRVAAEMGVEAAGTCAALTNVALSKAMTEFYSKMLCETINLYKGDQARAKAYLANLQKMMKVKVAEVVFPEDQSAVIDALVAGDCQKATQLLAALNTGSVTPDQFNSHILPANTTIKDELIDKITTLQCGCAGLADFTSGDGDCQAIIAQLGKVKAAYSSKQNVTLTKPAKNPLIGQISLGGQCYTDVQLSFVPDQTSLVIDPQYSQGSSSFGMGNAGNTYLTIRLTDAKSGQLESLKTYLFEGGNGLPAPKPPFAITGVQLKLIFPNTAQSRCDEVAAVINKYSTKFGIDNTLRMSHFLGQIGAETQLTYLTELTYSATNIKNSSFATTTRSEGKQVLKYCDLFEGYDATQTSSCPFPYCDPPLYAGTTNLEVKQKYVKSTTLFDYVYACRLGNGTIDSQDGSWFRGRGFVQLTRQDNYESFQAKWIPNIIAPNL
ncbi:hypothetical protein [Larkinella rosea]|uniref:hypothetical protein n=1 Tax=Larkinella rosea TaxID=2025312 RepID=UPI0011CF3464|nr:hypothetical protein [Larkinella rosea]